MTQPAAVATPELTYTPPPEGALWTLPDYMDAVIALLEDEFEEVRETLSAMVEMQRVDFDPRWQVAAEVPGRPDLVAAAMFWGEEVHDVVVYAFPIAQGDPKPKLWLRYTISRIGAATTVEGMPRDTFVSELSLEYAEAIAEDEDTTQPGDPDGGELAPDAP